MLSKKTKYAIKALVVLGKNTDKPPMQISKIAEEERIPKKFLEQILLDLRNAGFLYSKKGGSFAKNFFDLQSGSMTVMRSTIQDDGAFRSGGYFIRLLNSQLMILQTTFSNANFFYGALIQSTLGSIEITNSIFLNMTFLDIYSAITLARPT